MKKLFVAIAMICGLVCSALLPFSANAAPNPDPYIVKDIWGDCVGGSSPANLFSYNGALYFSAYDEVHGTELWKSDGTAEGTAMFMDIYPGIYTYYGPTMSTASYGDPNSSNPSYFTEVNGILYFSAADGIGGTELWKSNGTAEGTVMVKDIFPGVDEDYSPEPGMVSSAELGYPFGSSPSNLTNVNGTLYFAANDGVNGNELWKSNGTAEGTVMVKDIFPGVQFIPETISPTANGDPNNSNPNNLTDVNGTLFFGAYASTGSRQLWKSNGTAEGTVLVGDIFDGNSLNNFTNVNGTLFFTADDDENGIELWKSNGTTAQMVMDINTSSSSSPSDLTNFNGTLFFTADDGLGRELWKSDGTAENTEIAADINLAEGSNPAELTVIDDLLYFSANDGINGAELWVYDGIAEDADVLKDVYPGSHEVEDVMVSPAGMAVNSSSPANLTNVNGVLYFSAYGATYDYELWKSDGTMGGTVLVDSMNEYESPPDGWSYNFTDVSGVLFFTTLDDGSGSEYTLWKSDGTAEGTAMLTVVCIDSEPTEPNHLVNAGATLYFFATDRTHGEELWKSDGTDAGTVLVKDTNPGSGGLDPYGDGISMVAAGGIAYFTAYDADIDDNILWKSDGTAEGTEAIKDSHSGSLTDVNGTLYFTADGEYGEELWKSDGTTAGTVLVKDDIYGGYAYLDNLTNADGTLYFYADDDDGTYGLWKSDGTYGGTVPVKEDIMYPTELTNVNGTLYFRAYNSDLSSDQLWKSDGTTAGTVEVMTSYYLDYLTNVNGTLFFYADDDDGTYGLWKVDYGDDGAELIKDGIDPYYLTNVNGTLFLEADDGDYGYELWKSDGTELGTVMVKDINPYGSSYPYNLTDVSGVLFFQASDGTNGAELWKSDGTTDGTVMVKDIYDGGSGYSSEEESVAVGDTLYFIGDDGVHGDELWAYSLPDDTPPTFSNLPGLNVSINLTDGQTITTNPYIIAVKPADDYAIERVEFYVDGVLICTDYTADVNGVYTCAWDTSLYHSDIQVLAYDDSGNRSIALNRTVNVNIGSLPNTGLSAWYYLLGLTPAIGSVAYRRIWYKKSL